MARQYTNYVRIRPGIGAWVWIAPVASAKHGGVAVRCKGLYAVTKIGSQARG